MSQPFKQRQNHSQNQHQENRSNRQQPIFDRNANQQNLPQRNRWPFSLSAQIRKLGIPEYKTEHCKHKYGCIESILTSCLKITASGFLIKSGMSLVFGLRRIISNPKQIFKIVFSRDSFNFGFFPWKFVGLFRGILCLLRRYFSNQKQKYIPLIAGFFAGLFSVIFLQKKSRQAYALFLLARAIDVTYNSLVKKGILPQFKYFYVVLYSLMMAVTGYAFGSQPGSLSPQMNKFYLTFTNQTLGDMQMRQIWIQRKNNLLAQRGIAPQNPLDYMPKLRKYYQKLKG